MTSLSPPSRVRGVLHGKRLNHQSNGLHESPSQGPLQHEVPTVNQTLRHRNEQTFYYPTLFKSLVPTASKLLLIGYGGFNFVGERLEPMLDTSIRAFEHKNFSSLIIMLLCLLGIRTNRYPNPFLYYFTFIFLIGC